jgi:tetratricopeptide (TPR) repeat protein
MATETVESKPPAPKPPRLRGWKAWALKVTVALASAVLFLLLVEGVLWVLGFGQPTGFFVRWTPGGPGVYVANEDFGLRFVPKELARASDENIVLRPKARGATVRIFVLGESAAAGDPESAFGFCRALEAMLNETPGGRSFEVVNAAVTAINSHVVRHIARDCAGHEPDAFVVYMGNNEVVGPYGPASLPPVLYGETDFVRAAMAARATRTGQFVSYLATLGRGPAQKWQGMEAFLEWRVAFDDPRLQDCYRHFETNLQDIVSAALGAGAKVVLCTVPTNIRSCAPFGSQHRQGLAGADLDRWQALLGEGRKAEQAGRFAEALKAYRTAGEVDGTYADLAFSMARCAEFAGDVEAARRNYTRARDLDVLRFRADSRINAIIREQAKANEAGPVALADLEDALRRRSDKELLGGDLLVDHVHLSFRANVLAAAATARALAQVLPEAGIRAPASAEEVDRLYERLRRQLLYDVHAEFDIALAMYRRKTRPPFVSQLGHDAELAALRQRVIALRKAAKQYGRDRSEQEYLAAVGQAPRDAVLVSRLGELWLNHGKGEQVVRRYREYLEVVPDGVAVRRALAAALARTGEVDEAVETLTSRDHPLAMDLERALGYVGTSVIKSGRPLESEKVYLRLLEVNQRNGDALVNLGAAAVGRGDLARAAEYLHRALGVDAGSVDAMVNLANVFVKQHKSTEAREWFEKAVTADPYHHGARAGLGLQLMREGKIREAVEQLNRCVELNPAFPPPYQLLAVLSLQQGNRDQARQYAELADLFQPD